MNNSSPSDSESTDDDVAHSRESGVTIIDAEEQAISQREIDQNGSNIPKSMQDFFYSKMSKNIASSIEFVNIDGKRNAKKMKMHVENKPVMKLLKDTEPIEHFVDTVAFDEPIVTKHAKPSIVRRQIEPNEMTNEQKIRAVVIDGESILQGNEVRNWRPKRVRLHKIFKYREKNDRLYLVEPPSEFRTKRKRNNWSESKIAKWKLVK